MSAFAKDDRKLRAAARASFDELTVARADGANAHQGGNTTYDPVKLILQSRPTYAAEAFVPREDTTQPNVVYPWEWGKFDDAMRTALARALNDEVATAIRQKIPTVTAPVQQDKIRNELQRIAGELSLAGGNDPVMFLEKVFGKSAGGKLSASSALGRGTP